MRSCEGRVSSTSGEITIEDTRGLRNKSKWAWAHVGMGIWACNKEASCFQGRVTARGQRQRREKPNI